jgi:hypothetical protein|tara:strand:- start:266 stop:511 length:246 start_codon:yes stop_codon:yes gene_type:complete
LINLAFDALAFKYRADMLDAEYTFKNYLVNPAAIGEHPQLLEEMDKALDKWAAAKDKLDALNSLVQRNAPEEKPEITEGLG